MVVSTNPGWLQTAFDMLIGIFDWLGLRTNDRKTVVMVCQPCRVVRVRADKAYKIQIAGEG